jgi:hypothetical protein
MYWVRVTHQSGTAKASLRQLVWAQSAMRKDEAQF